MEERCIFCGAVIPEGRQVCPSCETGKRREFMSEEVKNEVPMMPVYQAEKIIMHQNFANRRMLIALITVCVTFIVTIVVFVCGYTVREHNWLNTLRDMQKTTPVSEVADGVQQNADH